MSSHLKNKQNQVLDSSTIFFATFITQLSAIIAQGSLRASMAELVLQILIWGVMLGFSLAFGWAYIQKEESSSKLPMQLTNGAAMVGLMAFLYQMVTTNITSAILLMLSWLLIALSFTFKRQRNLYFSLIASMTLLLYAASISKSSVFIVYIVIYTLAAIIALAGNFYLSKTKQQVKVVTGNTGFPFKLPITILAGLVLLITAGIYLFMPRPTALNWGIFPAGGGHYQASGSWPNTAQRREANGKDQFNQAFDKALERMKKNGMDTKALEEQIKKSGLKDKLSNINKQAKKIKKEIDKEREADAFQYSGFEESLILNQDQKDKSSFNQLVLYMEGKEPQYLRGKIFDYFDGLSWQATQQTRKRIDRKNNKFMVNRFLKGDLDLYTVTLAVNLAGDPNIFTPASTAEVQFPSNAIAKDNYGSLYAPRQIDKDTFYSIKIKSEGIRINGRSVDKIDKLTVEEMDRYIQLPEDISERFINFSKKISADGKDVVEKASKIERYLRKNYEYSFDSIFSSQGKIPLEEFLFEKPKGHCEYFATAMVTLMRAQEIPARLVTGFSVTTFNPVTGYYEARGSDAHAWAEVWVPKAGWVTFEATPAYALPKPTEAKNTSQSIEEYLKSRADNADLAEPESLKTIMIHTAKYAFEQLNIVLDKAWKGIKMVISWTGNMLLHYGWLVLLVAGGLFVMSHYLRYYLVHRRVRNNLRKLRKASAQKQLEQGYSEMEKIFALYKHPRKQGWTLHQYKAYLSQYYPELGAEVSQISDTLNACLYEKGHCQAKASDASSKQIAEAISSMKKVVDHKFKTPMPAEKQIKSLREFFNVLTSGELFRFGKNDVQ